MKYAKKQLKEIMENFGREWNLFKRRIRIKFRKFKAWLKENWPEAGLDLAIIVVCIFSGLLIGGFLGFLFVINALMV